MIKRVFSIAIAASLLSSCAVLTVQDVGGGNFYVQGILPNGAITRAKEFCNDQGKSFLAEKIEPASIIEGRSPSILFKCV
ncbi:hypothetical protein N9U60_03560 [Betaproteobacteria bacterium]|nr:hypothetical protein [Betaproteobacteria bacterium]